MKPNKFYFEFALATITLVFSVNIVAGTISEFSEQFEVIVKRHWKPSVEINKIPTTVFDYSGMATDFNSDKSYFKRAIHSLGQMNVKGLERGNVDKAFWLNLYNFLAIKLIVENYPVGSIKSIKISLIKYPWSVKGISVGGTEYSMKQIEKDILLKKYRDPRIIFAVSCAAVSCPDRTNEIFRPSKLDSQLDNMIRSFLKNSRKGMLVDRENKKIKLAWILKKDDYLFEGKDGSGVLDFVSKFVEADLKNWILENKGSIAVEYFNHDWSLNDWALRDEK